MSISFFIGPFYPKLWQFGKPDPAPISDLQIDPNNYSQKLFYRWPHTIRNSEYELSWTISQVKGGSGLRILLHSDKQYVSFGLSQNFTDFIVWHREVIPDKYPLFLHNSSSWDSLELLPGISREKIQEFTTFFDI
jgi:hypothetical protein